MRDTSPLAEQLLVTKLLIPQPSGQLLPRLRLRALLDQSFHRPLTLVCAPAGFGKTTLVASWLLDMQDGSSHSPHRVAWLSVDEADNTLERFWSYVLAALNTAIPGIAAPFLTYLRSGDGPIESLLISLINVLLGAPEPLFLVLDDYDLITESAIHHSLAFLLDHAPPQVHIVALSRTEPPLPLSRLRVRGQLLDIRAHHLRCTDEEAERFLTKIMGLQLSQSALATVIGRAEGWLAGLLLLGLWLDEHPAPEAGVDELAGSGQYILTYLTDEALRLQPPEIQRFLLQTAFLGRISAPLCDAVLERTDSQAMLELLVQNNLLLTPLDTARNWYRYHPLLTEALGARAQEDERRVLLLRASQWYRREGYLDEAISYALQAHAWEHAAGLISRAHFLRWRSIGTYAQQLRQWLERLPVEVVRAHPRLALAYAWSLSLVEPPSQVALWLACAERGAHHLLASEGAGEELDTQGDARDLLGEIAAMHALQLGIWGDWEGALARADEASTLIASENETVRGNIAFTWFAAYSVSGDLLAAAEAARQAAASAEMTGMVSARMLYLASAARALIAAGQLHAAQWLVEEAFQIGEAMGELRPAMWSLVAVMQADILRERGQLDHAAAQLGEIHHLMLPKPQGGLNLNKSLVMARLRRSQGELEQALAISMQTEIASRHFADVFRQLLLDRTLLWIALGQAEQARQWLDVHDRLGDLAFPFARERAELAYARIEIAEDRPAEALARMQPLLERLDPGRRRADVIALHIAQALAYHRLGEEARALVSLDTALALSQPEGQRQILVDEGATMMTLLRRLRSHGLSRERTDYLDQLLALFPKPPVTASMKDVAPQQAGPGYDHVERTPIELLTTREREVLRLLARGHTNLEIAERLIMSEGTIKTHLAHIYSKLGVHNRTQAIVEARSRGIV